MSVTIEVTYLDGTKETITVEEQCSRCGAPAEKSGWYLVHAPKAPDDGKRWLYDWKTGEVSLDPISVQ